MVLNLENIHNQVRSLLVERVRRAEAGEEKTVSNQAVFDTSRDKYGF